jgi:hypothetical protein
MSTKRDKIKRLVSVYNMLLNLLWSALSFIPLCIFCYTWVENNLLFLFVGLSLLPLFLSRYVIQKLQVAKKPITYKKLGVLFVQYLSQNGVFINYLIRKKYPRYKAVRRDRKSIEGLLKQTYVFEKFHLVGFLFSCLISFYAISKSLTGWAFVLMLINVVYNVYPILLQQYIRAKLSLYQMKNNANIPSANEHLAKYRFKCIS